VISISIPLSPLEMAFAFAVTAIGATVQGSVGFGLGLIAAPLLLLIDPAMIPGPMLAAALVLTVLVAWRDRRAMDLHGLKFAIVGRVFGTVPAALLVSVLSRAVFDLVFGGLVLLAVGLSLVGPRVTPTPRGALAAGGLSGFMATVSSVGGPPMALLYQHADGPRLRGTLAGFFTFGATLSLISLALVGRFGAQEAVLALLLVPGVLAGYILSNRLGRNLDRAGVRPAVLGLSFVSAVVVLLHAIL
jgi:uncharacterized membrane protein YfcA